MPVKIGDREYSAEDIQALKELAEVLKNDPASTTPTAAPLYGPYHSGSSLGVFSAPGIRPEMFSAFQRPRTLASILGIRKSTYANEKIGIMTGVTDATGSNAEDFCGDPPTAGTLKRCVQNYVFGRWFFKTRLNVIPEMGELVDRTDMEKRLLNLKRSPSPFMPEQLADINIGNRAGLQLANELFTLGVAWERGLEKVLVRGNRTLAPASTERGFIKEFDGLERQVITGRVDVDSLLACAAADSQVITWARNISATDAMGRTFPQLIVDTVFGLEDIAEQTGLGGVQFALVMPMRMFRALSYIYACSYWTSRCDGSAGNPQAVDARETRALQLDIMANQYLPIDGRNYPVIFSDGILETHAGNSTFTADEMFILPVEWNGMRLLNVEYKPMDNEDITSFTNFAGAGRYRVLNNGMFLVGVRSNGMCDEYLFAAKPRLILDAPFLAARIDDITYTYSAPYRSAFPGDSTSYVDGGANSYQS